MVEWSSLNSKKINRVGYNKKKEILYIDFNGSDTDMIFSEVPEALYQMFLHVKTPDEFYTQFVDGYFEVKQLSS